NGGDHHPGRVTLVGDRRRGLGRGCDRSGGGFGSFLRERGGSGEERCAQRARAAKNFADHSGFPLFGRADQSAVSPDSPVRMRTADARSRTKTLPSPMASVLAVCWIVSTICGARSSGAATSIFTLGNMLVEYSAPR